MWSRERQAVFSVDHVVPRAEDPEGFLDCEYANLLYACTRCNSARQDVRVLDPTVVAMADHVRVESDGTMAGFSEGGSFLIEFLHLNAKPAVDERNRITRVLRREAEHPEDEGARIDFRMAFGYPDDLPDLGALRPPSGNTLAENVKDSFFARRATGRLAATY
jgi:hypothetical protein